MSAACLVDEGLVEAGFSRDDLLAILESGDPATLPFDPEDPTYLRCIRDPKSLVGDN